MEKYLIGYKQGNGAYVYVSAINDYNVAITLHDNNAIEFYNEDIAKNVCEFLNLKDKENTYLPIMLKINITEITKGDK